MNQKDFFKENSGSYSPLASRMAPKTLEEYMGQTNIVGDGKLLRRAIEADSLGSVVFYGPSGSGKTALASIIASKTSSYFERANAVLIGISDIRTVLEQAKNRLAMYGKKTILMLDEIHHFNRTQQDALLPDIESGIITLIGITTENPFFYINSAILSRTTVFEFQKLEDKDLLKILDLSLLDKERGFGNLNIQIEQNAKEHLIKNANGDARRLLNAVEIGVLSTMPNQNRIILFDLKVAEESIQKRSLSYDRNGDQHYDHISAFIKSMRGSDPDATVYWMSKMLVAGEDPRFIARRIIICASEDVGNADPRALTLAVSAMQAVEFIGMPEARIILAQAAIYVATAPKSNASYLAVDKAIEEVKNGKQRNVPNHLKDASLDGKEFGHGQGYKYPHDFENHFVEQKYFDDPVEFYVPTNQGYEVKISERLNKIRKK
ncbi:MAG: replication-associated recombination protein A [Endomicrobiaceae bacterium]|nr:replication-associated recombination protein A [Endomicrobiaceae bacterium]